MKALCWYGKKDIRYESVPDPIIEEPTDAIIKVSSCAICGSDLHLFDGFMPGMEKGDVMGHECMGEVVEVGSGTQNLRVGDRVVIPFTITCGECDQCRKRNFSVCERTNRNKAAAEKVFGHSPAGLFGYTHLTGGYPGGQAEYLRVPFADSTHIKVPSGISDEQLLFLSDILPTGWQAAAQANIQHDDIVAIWGAGPVGQMTIRSALMMQPQRVIVIDNVPERLAMAAIVGAEIIDFSKESVVDRLNELTGGKGPTVCIDAVGMEAHVGGSVDSIYDRAKQAVMAESDRPHVLREMIYVCRPAGTLSVAGVYGGFIDKVPFGASMNKGLTWKMGQTHVRRWTPALLAMIEKGDLDPSFVITHTAALADGADMYKTFRDKEDGCIKVVLKP